MFCSSYSIIIIFESKIIQLVTNLDPLKNHYNQKKFIINKASQFLLMLMFSISLLCAGNVQGQTVVTVGGGATITCPATPTATWTTPPTGVTFSNWSRGGGVTCQTVSNGLAGSAFNSLSANAGYAANKYFSVTITADATHPFALTSITWLTSASSGNFDIQYSNNGGTITSFGTTGTSTSSNTYNGNVIVAAGTSIVLYLIPWNITGKVTWLNGSTITLIAANSSTAKFWVGYGAGGTSAQTDLGTAANWSPSGVPTSSNSCYMNFGSYTGTFNLTQLTSGLSMNALNVILASNSTTAITQVTIGASQNFSPGALSITNSSSGSFNDEIDFNITGGTTTCSSVQTVAGGSGTANPNLYINIGASLICNGSWTSSALDNNVVSTYIKNSGTLTINGVDSIYDSKKSNIPIRFLVDNTGITTFNGRVRLGSTTKADFGSVGYNNTVLLGGYTNSSTGQFVFNTTSDSVTIGYNMGTENFKKGTFLFTGTALAIGSYARSDTTPDRSPGTFQVGTSSIHADVSFTSIGDNNALTVYNLLLVSSYSVFTVKAAVIPAEIGNKATIQLNPYSTLNLGVNQGASSTLPTNYLNYIFDATSTINYQGNTQNVYSGANYGNLTLSNTGIKRAGGSITVLGNLLITDAAVFDLNNSAFNNSNNFTDTIGGNWTNNSTDASGGIQTTASGKVTLMFNGSSNTTIGGNNANTFYGIRVDKTSGAVLTMNQNLIVTNVDSFTNGALAINGNKLTLGGTIVTTSGTITGSSTSNLITGATGTLKFTTGSTNNYLKTFTLNTGAITLGNALNIAQGTNNNCGTVTVNSGATLNAGNNLTLKSDRYGTARVASSAGTINDSVVVERFIPPGRKWRFLSIPVTTNQTINAAWQEGVTNPDVYTQNNPNPGYGTDITYNGTTGFDPNTTTNPSLKIWDYTIKGWSTYAPVTTQLINNYPAYCIFVRGSRAVDLSQGTYAMQDSTVLRTKGILKQHNLSQSFASVSSGDFVFIGNPYPSSIDLTGIFNNANGIYSNKFWVWDPGYGGNFGVGGYVVYDNGVMSPLTTNYPIATKIMESGQGFLVQANASSGSLSFQESDKSDSEKNVFSLTTTTSVNYPAIYTNLMIPQGNDYALADGIATAFDNKFSAGVDGNDAVKLWNFNENIALVRGTSTLAIEFRPDPVLTDTLFYRLYLRQQPYTLKIFTQYFNNMPAINAWLVDTYLNTKTQINLHDTTWYNFSPNPDTISYRNRFKIVFAKQLSTSPVPVTKVVNQSNPNITGSANTIAETRGISIFPNPVDRGAKAMLRFNDMKAGSYAITIYNAKGQKLSDYIITHNGSSNMYVLPLNAGWSAGVYTIMVHNETLQKAITLKLMVDK